MSMNLKPAIRYQLREYLVSCLVFWAINALLIGIGFLVLSLNLGSGDRSGYTYNGYGFACAIFFLVFGLILPRQAIRLCVQMGVSRRTTFLSLFLSALLPAVCLSLAGELLLSLAQFAADHTQFQLEFSDLFSMIYLKQGLPLTFLQHTASILFFNKEGSAMLKIFLGRDDHRQLLSEQVSAFHALAASLKEHA